MGRISAFRGKDQMNLLPIPIQSGESDILSDVKSLIPIEAEYVIQRGKFSSDFIF